MNKKYEIYGTKSWDELPKCLGTAKTISAAKGIITKMKKTTQFVWVTLNGDKVVL